MALEFLCGFDHYTALAAALLKWTGPGGTRYTSVAGRFGGLAYSAADGSDLLTATLANQATRIAGFAFKTPTSFNAFGFATFRDASTAQVELRCDASGHIVFTRTGAVVGTSTAVLSANTWYYIEWKVTIHASAGVYEVRVDGTNVLSGSSANTQSTANAFSNQFRLATFTANPPSSVVYDDVYVLDTSGSLNNNFLGPCRIHTSLPNAEGSTLQWTPSTGTAHWAVVDESTPNSDTDYISTATAGQIDLLNIPDISPTGPILGVQTVLSARKDDAPVRQIADQCKSAATSNTGSTTQTLTTSYAMYRQIRETDPDTAAAWTLAGFNAAEFGVKLIA